MAEDINTGAENAQTTEINTQLFKDAYVKHVLLHGAEPKSIYSFCADLGINEAQFYEFYGSFNAIAKDVWVSTITDTVKGIKDDEVYLSYSVREKLLAFYYTWIENLKSNRSFVKATYKPVKMASMASNSPVKYLKTPFKEYAEELIIEGYEKGELQQRPVISDGYVEALWLQVLFVLHFWINDDTAKFERTDAAIEKAVNLSMDLMSRNTLDNAFDFAKFLFERK